MSMHGKHIFPSNIYKFLAWVENFEFQCTEGRVAAILQLPQQTINTMHGQIATVKQAQAAIDEGGNTSVNYASRNYERKQLEAYLRNVIGEFVRGQPNFTPEMLTLLKLNVPDTKRTPLHVPNIEPDIEVDFATHLRHFIHFGKIGTKNKIVRGLPKGATGVQVWRCVGDNSIPDITEFEFVGEVSRSPLLIDYEDTMFGKHIWYAIRYYNFKHEFGPWSLKKVVLVN